MPVFERDDQNSHVTDEIDVTPLECLGLKGYIYRLWFWMLVPIVVVLAVVLAVLLSSALKKYQKRRFAKREATRKLKRHDSGAEAQRHQHEDDGQRHNDGPWESMQREMLRVHGLHQGVVDKGPWPKSARLPSSTPRTSCTTARNAGLFEKGSKSTSKVIKALDAS